MSDEDKASFKENFLNLIKEGKTVVGSYTVARNPETVKDSSGWISGMQAISRIVFAIFNIIGVCALINSPYGIVLFLGCFFVGFLSVGMTMVFLDMARDLKAIRTMLEKK